MVNSPLLDRLSYLSAQSTLASTLDHDLAAAVRRAMEQSASANHAREVRQERIYAAVQAEGGMLPVTMALPRRLVIVRRGIGNRLADHDLSGVPSARSVRAALRKLDEKRNSVVSSEATTEGAQPSPIRQRAGGV